MNQSTRPVTEPAALGHRVIGLCWAWTNDFQILSLAWVGLTQSPPVPGTEGLPLTGFRSGFQPSPTGFQHRSPNFDKSGDGASGGEKKLLFKKLFLNSILMFIYQILVISMILYYQTHI